MNIPITILHTYLENKVPRANMGPIWGRQGPGGPHVGPLNFVIWVVANSSPGREGFADALVDTSLAWLLPEYVNSRCSIRCDDKKSSDVKP